MAVRKTKAKSAPGRGRPKGAVTRQRTAPARLPGRPRLKSADQRARLLDAALACYVRQGIGGTSLRDIATEAGVTPALVHYYFGDARQLLEAVIAERVMPAFYSVRDAVIAAGGDHPAALVATFVNAICRAVEMYPWWPSLWVREVISEGGALRSLMITRIAPELTRAIAQRFASAQAEGRLNPALDPRLIVVSLVGLTLFPAAGAPIWRQVFDAGDLTMEHVRAHALELLAHGLEMRP
jgi:TetR/AcrR family transcriptional regulator